MMAVAPNDFRTSRMPTEAMISPAQARSCWLFFRALSALYAASLAKIEPWKAANWRLKALRIDTARGISFVRRYPKGDPDAGQARCFAARKQEAGHGEGPRARGEPALPDRCQGQRRRVPAGRGRQDSRHRHRLHREQARRRLHAEISEARADFKFRRRL